MRTATLRRLAVGAGVCAAAGVLFVLPGRSNPAPTPLVGVAPVGPFPTGSAAVRTPIPLPSPSEPTPPPEPTPSPTPTPSRSRAPRPTMTWTAATSHPGTSSVSVQAAPTSAPTAKTPTAEPPTSAPTSPTISATALPTRTEPPSPMPTASPTPTATPSADFPYASTPTLSVPRLDDVCNTDQTSFTVSWQGVEGVDHYYVTTSQLGGPFTVFGSGRQIACPTSAGTFTITVVGRNAAGDKETETSQASMIYSPPLGGLDMRVALTTS